MSLPSLQALGVIIAIDDFGTGYAGLSYLGNMQINLLKIDRSFVAMIAQEDSTTDLVDVVIDLANRFGKKLSAKQASDLSAGVFICSAAAAERVFGLVSSAVSLAQRRFAAVDGCSCEAKKRLAARLNGHCQ